MKPGERLCCLLMAAVPLFALSWPARADVWVNENLRPPEPPRRSVGDLEKSLKGVVSCTLFLLGGFNSFECTNPPGEGTTLLRWSGGRVRSSDPAQNYCYKITGNRAIYPAGEGAKTPGGARWTSPQFEDEDDDPPDTGESDAPPTLGEEPPDIDSIPSLSFLYELFPDGYLVFLINTTEVPIHLEDVSVGSVPSPLDITQLSFPGLDAAEVTWVFGPETLDLPPNTSFNLFVSISPEERPAVVYRARVTFVPQDPRVFPSEQVGQGHEAAEEEAGPSGGLK